MQETQKTTNELKRLTNLMGALPKPLVSLQLKKVWKTKTMCLDNPKKNEKEITALQNPIAKLITFKKKPVYDWLEEIKTQPITDKHKEFIEYFKTEYPFISLKKQGIM